MSDGTATPIGVIGLGAMGLGMARSHAARGLRRARLRRAGRGRSSAGGGGRRQPPASPAAAAAGAEVVIVMVVNAAQAEAVLLGPDGAVSAMAPDGVVVLSCTVPAADARALAEKVAAAGRLFARRAGQRRHGRRRERQAHLHGERRAGGVRQGRGGARGHGGQGLPAGRRSPASGSTVKAVNQLLAGVHIAAAAEAMAFGVRAGADPRTLFEVISNSAGNSWMFGNRVPHMLDGDYTPRSAVDIFVKDLGLVLDAGRDLRFPLPQAAAAHQLFLMAAAAGLGREDDAAVVKVFERLAGIDVSRPEAGNERRDHGRAGRSRAPRRLGGALRRLCRLLPASSRRRRCGPRSGAGCSIPAHEVEGLVALGAGRGRDRHRPLSALCPPAGGQRRRLPGRSVRGAGGARVGRRAGADPTAWPSVGRERGWTVIRWITAEDNYRGRAVYDRVAEKTRWLTYEIKLTG